MLTEVTNELIATARNHLATEEQLNAAAQAFLGEAVDSTKSDAEGALKSLCRHFDLDDPERGAFLALVCGVLVERGADPAVITEPLINRLSSLLKAAGELATAAEARLPAIVETSDSSDPFEIARGEVEETMPEQAIAWSALDRFWHPAIAVFSRSTAAREAAQSLRDSAGKISQYHAAGHWISLILTVLDQEPILVIEPETSLGIVGRISGIVDNFQLNTLLMDAFPQASADLPRRVSRDAADVARGEGPQQTEESLTSVWNLYHWQAIRADRTLPSADQMDSSDEFWIWNEGVPADIALFEGYRVVLLGPPSYPRSWQSQRMFEGLPANLHCERVLTPTEIDEWLQRMSAAQHEQ
jgi:hypothetical protein